MPDNPLPTASRAVFLSYAREDTDAARRIADALRAFGVEVWFDQSELRGGDTWDAKIKKQIRECALFLPLVSSQTQGRAEGYFRREWLLAVERTRDMAHGVAFIVPIAIDDTREADAAVPEEFMRVQWTRLAHGVPSPQFVEQIKRLLVAPRKASSHARPEFETGASPVKRASRFPTWLVISLAAGLLALVAYIVVRPSAAPAPKEKSVAVLPFVNMSSDKENEYLSDGITEEILNVLAKVPGLRVPARTSSFVFKDKKEDIKKIGELLRVNTVLEGSVRKAGNQLRVTVQLINVADGYHLWSETYDREMTNIFAIQDEIARTVAAKLKVTLAGPAGLPSAKRRNENVDAYELVLKGKFYAEKVTESGFNQAITCYTRALALQPDYALAYAELAGAYGSLSFFGYVPPGSLRPQQRAAVAKALQLDDTLADAHVSLAMLSFYVDWNWSAAEREFKRALELEPENVSVRESFAFLLMVTGRHPEAVTEINKAVQLDPLSVQSRIALGWAFYFGRNFDRAVEAGREAIALAPDTWRTHQMTGRALFSTGRREEGIGELEEARRLAPISQAMADLGAMYAQVGRKAEAERILEELLTQAKQRYVSAYSIALVYGGLGEIDQTDVWMRKAIEDRESRLLFLKVAFGDLFRSNPHYPEWLKKIGLDK